MVDLTDRQVLMFRCHIDPMIGYKAQQAFKLDDPLLKPINPKAYFSPGNGVYVTWTHKDLGPMLDLVPLANLQSVKLKPDDESKQTIDIPTKPKLGRPFKSDAV